MDRRFFGSHKMNVASSLAQRATSTPDSIAVCYLNEKISYHELNQLSDRFAWEMKEIGIQKGSRLLLMVTPGIEFIALTFAILKMGAIAILIDPGIGKNSLKKCIHDVKPDGFIGIPKAHLMRWLWPSSFRETRYFMLIHTSACPSFVSATLAILFRCKLLRGIHKKGGSIHFLRALWLRQCALRKVSPPLLSSHAKHLPFPLVDLSPNDTAAIIFTTGSTGPPKGVVYEHGMFAAQIELLRSTYQIREGEIDMPMFPLFALFSTAMGTTCVIPDMDPTRPANVDPRKIVQAIQEHHVTYTFGSPALWNRVTLYCLEKNIRFPTVKRILIAGAPVSPKLLERFQKILSSDAEVFTPYGATEALPLTSIGSREIVSETASDTQQGKGICVGRPLSSLDVRIIKISDEPIAFWEKSLELPENSIGEIVVKGPVVTKEYDHNEKETALAKMKERSLDPTPQVASGLGMTYVGSVWHRMGDVGYFDSRHRLWFCGRKAHRVVTPQKSYFSIPCESIFNQHPEVFRSALVGVNRTPVIIIEPHDKKILSSPKKKEKLKMELLAMARRYPLTEDIETIFFFSPFPVDIRHNAKIIREKLSLWAKKYLSGHKECHSERKRGIS